MGSPLNVLLLSVMVASVLGCHRERDVGEALYSVNGVRCRLTWTGPQTGWRLQTTVGDMSFDEGGAAQKLASFMDEPSPTAARKFRLVEKEGRRLCRAQDGSSVTIDERGMADIRSAAGKLVTESVSVRTAGEKSFLSGRLLDREPVYGLGQRLDRLNKRGQRVEIYTTDGFNNSDSTYMAIPLFTTHRGGGVFVNLYERMTADFGAAEENTWRFEVEKSTLDAYFFAKDDIPEALTAYTALTGHADEPEAWNAGPVICRYYPDLKEFEGPFVCKFDGMTLRGHGLKDIVDRHIALGVKPSAVIVESGNFADLYGDPARRAKLKKMSAYLKEKGIRLMVYMRMGDVCSYRAPGFRPEFNVSASVATNGVVVQSGTKRIPNLYATGVNPDAGSTRAFSYADITDPAFWNWYVNVVWKDLVACGVRGVKIDFCELMPEEGENPGGVAIHYRWKNPSVFAGTAVHHAYPTFFISKFYRAMTGLTKDRDGFMVLSRGGGIGSQRNPYLWAGDQMRLFEKLDDHVLALLNSGMSGVPFMTYDLAGYRYDGYRAEPDGEINGTPVSVRRGRTLDAAGEAAVFRRGVEFTAFTTCVQSHGFVRNCYDFDTATQEHYRKYMRIHAGLSNVIERLNREAAATGIPPVRPLVFRYPDDPNTWDVSDEFLLGDALLVAPVFSARPRRNVYLPKGNWNRISGLELPVYVNRDSPESRDVEFLLRYVRMP